MKRAENDRTTSLSFAASGEGPPVLLLHGMSGSRHWWSRNVPALAERFRTYCIDLPGFGGSRGVPWERIDHTVTLLMEWMENEGLANGHVIGHSLGGAVAARLAALHPDRVDRLILVDAAIRLPRTRLTIRGASIHYTFRRRPEGLAQLVARDLFRSHPRSFFVSGIDLLGAKWEKELSAIPHPALIVWGEHDLITPVSLGARLATLLPDAQLAVIPEAGHSPMWEQAERFNRVALDFLAGSEREMDSRRSNMG